MSLQDVNLQHASWHRHILYALQLTHKPFDPKYAVCAGSISKPVSRDRHQGCLAGQQWSCVYADMLELNSSNKKVSWNQIAKEKPKRICCEAASASGKVSQLC